MTQLEYLYNNHQSKLISELSHKVSVTPVVSIQDKPRKLSDLSQGEIQKMGHNYERLLRPERLRKKGAGKQLIDKTGIARPVGSQAVPPSAEELRKLSLLTVPKPPRIDTQNLGTANEGLHSHPTDTLLETYHSDKEIKKWHRKLVICERDNEDYTLLNGPVPSKDIFGKRRQGNGFRKPDYAEENVEESVKKATDCTIPAIRLVPPPEGDVEPSRSLAVDEAYKILFRRSERENRSLRGLIPLAWLLAEAEGIDIHDTAALVEALEGIIKDRQRLLDLLPLAATLCADQGIDPETGTLETLPRVLDRVLKDREAAKFAAGHAKRAKLKLERRVIQLENKLSDFRCGDEEDYMRH
ncbi:hypothetical protein F5B18DRAFT_671937 [Nemania serpens]|nr:hypothetical protein F5B18DRAFT_671937 [Nemania serpens]